ncbi:hypothetical protein [Myroides odoratus]|uniref:hypothetical protein n=1 Tax=Myroides odoratus TaxID=256 RepID=UPI003340BCC0
MKHVIEINKQSGKIEISFAKHNIKHPKAFVYHTFNGVDFKLVEIEEYFDNEDTLHLNFGTGELTGYITII